MPLQLHGDQAAHIERPSVDQDDMAMPAHQRDGAPAKPAVAHRLPREALHQDVNLVTFDSHVMSSLGVTPNLSPIDKVPRRFAHSLHTIMRGALTSAHLGGFR